MTNEIVGDGGSERGYECVSIPPKSCFASLAMLKINLILDLWNIEMSKSQALTELLSRIVVLPP